MNVIPPLEITAALLTSSTVFETAPTAYNGATTYADGDTASVAGSAGLITVYESLQAANTGNAPASSPDWWVSRGTVYQAYDVGTTYAADDYAQDNTNHLIYKSLAAGNLGNALTDTTKWVEIGPTNKWAMFDMLRNTATSVPSSMTVVITPGQRVNSIALLGMVANSAQITVTSGGSTVFDETIDLNTREVVSWYQYFFEPFSTQPSLALFNLPPYTNAVITVTLTATSGNVECGVLAIGTYEFIGTVQFDAQSDVLNFSTVERDFAGNTSVMVQRRNVPKTFQDIVLAKSKVNRVRDLRNALNGSPAIWSGLDDSSHDYFESLLIAGFYKKFTINLRHPEHAVIALELEEI